MKSAAVDFRAVLPHAEEESLTQKVTLLSSVSDPVFFSRIRIRLFFLSPDPDRQKIRIRIHEKYVQKP